MEENVRIKVEEAEEEKGIEQSRAVFGSVYDRSQLPDLLKVYYRWLFPFKEYFKWLCYGKFTQLIGLFSRSLFSLICVRFVVHECFCIFVREIYQFAHSALLFVVWVFDKGEALAGSSD